MEVRAKAVSLALSLFVAVVGLGSGCSVGEYGTNPGGSSNMTPDAAPASSNNPAGEASFNATIKPLVMNACVSCHNGGTPPNLSSFSALQAKYKTKPGSTNILVTKGDHSGIQYFNATDKMTVQNWIDGL